MTTDLDRLAAAHAASTPGPWQVEGCRGKFGTLRKDAQFHGVGPDGDAVAAVFYNTETGQGFSDAKFIALAHNAMPNLIAELRQLRAERDALREAFLETREMLGLAEPIICEECCPTTWKTADGQPHCRLHEDICAVLFKYEKCRDTALGGEHE